MIECTRLTDALHTCATLTHLTTHLPVPVALYPFLFPNLHQIGRDGRPTGLQKISGEAVEAILGCIYRQYVGRLVEEG